VAGFDRREIQLKRDVFRMAVKQPIRLQPKPKGLARVIQRRNVPTLALGAIALALAILIFHDLFTPAANTLAGIRTALVSTGVVTNTVTASGSLVPAQQLNLGFKTPGTLTEVDALTGATVKAGQTLARIDTAPLQLALTQAQATLASAEAAWANTSNGTSLQQAQDQLAQAQQNYGNAVASQTGDQNTLNADSTALNLDRSSYWYTQYQPNLTTFQAMQSMGQSYFAGNSCPVSTMPSVSDPYPTPPASCGEAVRMIQDAETGISCLQGAAALSCTVAEQQIGSAYRAVQGAQAQVSADQARVNADSSQVQNAANAVTNATDGYNSQAANRPATLQMEQAQVAAAQSQVSTAQTNLDAATLVAPVDGVITAVNAQVGESVTANAGSSGAEAPGTTALLPSSGSSSSGGNGGATPFMTEVGTANYQTVVAFAESDAARVAAGQVGQVTLDAISGLTIPVHVVAVAGAAAVVSNVVNYYVTLALESSDSRLRPGMTTNATIITAEADNVLTVQNSAILKRGAEAFVTVLQGTRKVIVAVTLGIVGSTSTEIKSGLKDGDTVVLPTLGTTTTTGAGLTRGGGRLGGGGVVVGGGG
jgi:HlyD family secretion protein